MLNFRRRCFAMRKWFEIVIDFIGDERDVWGLLKVNLKIGSFIDFKNYKNFESSIGTNLHIQKCLPQKNSLNRLTEYFNKSNFTFNKATKIKSNFFLFIKSEEQSQRIHKNRIYSTEITLKTILSLYFLVPVHSKEMKKKIFLFLIPKPTRWKKSSLSVLNIVQDIDVHRHTKERRKTTTTTMMKNRVRRRWWQKKEERHWKSLTHCYR
jgi:hypothetical protein